ADGPGSRRGRLDRGRRRQPGQGQAGPDPQEDGQGDQQADGDAQHQRPFRGRTPAQEGGQGQSRSGDAARLDQKLQ
ncbi:hypothetical protein DQE84_20615, partial [Staphylococcus warneri]